MKPALYRSKIREPYTEACTSGIVTSSLQQEFFTVRAYWVARSLGERIPRDPGNRSSSAIH